MRTTAIAFSIALLAACSESEPPPDAFGGFEPQDQAALIFAPTAWVVAQARAAHARATCATTTSR